MSFHLGQLKLALEGVLRSARMVKLAQEQWSFQQWKSMEFGTSTSCWKICWGFSNFQHIFKPFLKIPSGNVVMRLEVVKTSTFQGSKTRRHDMPALYANLSILQQLWNLIRVVEEIETELEQHDFGKRICFCLIYFIAWLLGRPWTTFAGPICQRPFQRL